MMKPVDYIRGNSLKAAEKTLVEFEGRARPLAGGTDLLGGLKDAIHPAPPEALVDLKRIEGLSGVEERADGVYIGAMTRLRDLARDPVLKERFKALAQAAEAVASPQIRNMGTLAGNLCQEPRCWYYRNPHNTFHCARKGGDRCNALTGDNRFHSVFGSMRVGRTPCTAACPVQTDIAAYLELLRDNRVDEAASVILEVNPMPAVTGRVCPHFCEQQCNRGGYDEPVSVRGIERFLGDHILAHPDRFLSLPAKESGRSVAVVGSGPSGLAAAWFLRRSGHRVVVFDRMEKAGGMLRYAIPSFRLPKEVVDRVVEFLEAVGVTFVLGVEIGRDAPPSKLLEEHDTVYTAGGAWATPSIGLEGEAHTMTGLAFLASVQKGQAAAPGKRVLVIGGGNVAVDAAVTAGRLGAEEVVMACLESRGEMPALDWEVRHALEEGIGLMTSLGPLRVLTSGGRVTGVELVACTSVFDAEGRFAPCFDTRRTKIVSCDAVILAVGQRPDSTLNEPGTETEGPGVDPVTQATRVQGIFAGGDAVSGPATVVEAIAAGHRAARGMNAFLGTVEPEGSRSPNLMNRFARSALAPSARREPEPRPPEARTRNEEDLKGLDNDQVAAEAGRCFNCGCVAVCPSDLAPVLTALEARIVTSRRTLPVEAFFAVSPLSSTVLEDGELVTGVFIPVQKDLKTSYVKFRIRNAIDFPIAGAAVALQMEGDTVRTARIVLGAAAPVPLRARRAERVLEGKTPGEAEAVEAAEAALKGAVPLGSNAYKVNVLQALVKRAIMKALASQQTPKKEGRP